MDFARLRQSGFGGMRSTSIAARFTLPASNGDPPPHTLWPAASSGLCADSSASKNLSRHSCLPRSVVRHSRPEDSGLWSRVSVKRLDSTFGSTLTCSGMRAVTRLPIKSIQLVRCRRISVIAISNTPSGTLSFHQRGLRISGATSEGLQRETGTKSG